MKLRIGSWDELGDQALAVREEVFVAEQGVPAEIEHDTEDTSALHALVLSGSAAVGTGRLTSDGHIGRMAVRREFRGRGVGSRILAALITAAAAQGRAELSLSAQLHAVAFYERLGFVAYGEVFEEAGIAHRRMRRVGLDSGDGHA